MRREDWCKNCKKMMKNYDNKTKKSYEQTQFDEEIQKNHEKI